MKPSRRLLRYTCLTFALSGCQRAANQGETTDAASVGVPNAPSASSAGAAKAPNADGTKGIDENGLTPMPMFEAAGMSHQQASAFLQRLKLSVAASDWKGLAHVIDYPLSISLGGKPASIANQEDFLKHRSEILTSAVKEAISGQSPANLFANEGGIMIGNGEVWFRCPDRMLVELEVGSYRCDDVNIRIVRINNR